MDILETCYTSQMRLFADDPDRLTLGRWAWCPPGARPLPFPTIFAASVWDPYFIEDDYPLGELRGSKGRSSGRTNPRYLGLNWCGAVELFQQGSPLALLGTPPVDAEGVPLCCRVSGPALGGMVSEGDGIVQSWSDVGLWLRPEELTSYSESDSITSWPRAPLTPRDGIADSAVAPLLLTDEDTGWRGGLWNGDAAAATLLTVTDLLPLPGDVTSYVVSRALGPGIAGPVLSDPDGTRVPGVGRTSVSLEIDAGTNLAGPSTAHIVGGLIIWSGRRWSGALSIWADGVEAASGTDVIPQAGQLSVIAAGANLSGHTALCWIPEIIVFKRILTPAEDAYMWSYLQTKYAEVNAVRTGGIVMMAMSTPIDGYLICDGSEYASAAFPALSAYLGGAYDTFRGQSAPAAGNFRVPQLNGLVPVAAGAAAASPTTSAYTGLDTGGEEAHQLIATELAAHSHGVTDPGHLHGPDPASTTFLCGKASGTPALVAIGGTVPFNGRALTANSTTGVTVGSAGGNVPHNNVQPYVALYAFIKT